MMHTDKYPTERLNRKLFADALQKGLGRAYLHVSSYGLEGVSDLVLKACLHRQSYDPQSESSKAEWLYNMFKDSPRFDEFSNAILNSLRTKRDTWDLQQLFELSFLLAQNGDKRAREAIKERAFRKASKDSTDEWLGAHEWIQLAGIDGTIELAGIYGSRLLRDPEDFVPENEIFHDEQTKKDFHNRLFKESFKDVELKAYWDYLERRGKLKPSPNRPVFSFEAALESQRENIRQKYNVNSILIDAHNNIDNYGIRYRQFGKFATRKELEMIYSHLLKETDDAVRLRLLWVFQRASVPKLNNLLFLWANGRRC